MLDIVLIYVLILLKLMNKFALKNICPVLFSLCSSPCATSTALPVDEGFP